ncbi:hypothetical protein F5B22DRAFT_661639 [Xylaria bambusicola]|uniref:uncharacterized protein n=1 Tax=Xylaria bambusicola TaxID=326684 RepID=UPI0020080BBF|nr:uncharacterized protein F5B22DRAFT_661639 [Xylaria bambusicola]KAI0505328.1 hypothetical protein F5B22DRAFT_661639 [Xylaria bambusicola]
MDAHGAEAFTAMANMLIQLAEHDPRWRVIELFTIVTALQEGLPATLPQNAMELGDFRFWLNLQKRAAEHLEIEKAVSSGRVANERSQQQKIAVKPADHDDDTNGNVSDAISDTSFTPPKNLGKHVQFDKHGRRHIVLPPQPAARTPYVKRVTQNAARGQQQLEPKPAKLTFERKRDFHKPSVEYSGISLAVKAARADKPKETEKHKKKKSHSTGKQVQQKCLLGLLHQHSPTDSRHHKSSNHASSGDQATAATGEAAQATQSSGDKKPVTLWYSRFMKALFEQEEDLLFSGRWPISTF